MKTEIQIKSLDGCHMRRIMHMDGGGRDGRWFANIEQVIEHPRLARTVKQWTKRTKQPETTWSLDGEPIGTLENTLAAYNALPLPPVNATDVAMLQQLTDDWKMTPVPPFSLTGLRDKGLVEFSEDARGIVRRTDLAREILKGEV